MKFKDFTQDQKNEYVKEANKLCSFLSMFKLTPHLGFGSLLGSVREGKFIDGDYDIDICYMSKYNTHESILDECRELYETLNRKGWLLKYWSLDYIPESTEGEIKTPFGQAHIKLGKFVIDLFTTWIDEDGNYNTCQWGNLGKHKGFKESELESTIFNIPVNSNEILSKLYGNWKVPADDHPGKLIERKAYLKPIKKTVTSIVLKRFHCIKQKKEFRPKQIYICSMDRVEEILSKDKYLRIIKIE